jgi:hypothetical protein
MQIKILLNQQNVQFYLDTGSDIDVIDELTYADIGKPPIEPCYEIGKATPAAQRERKLSPVA